MEVVTSRKNPLIAHIKKLMSERSYRRCCREYVCEGKKLLDDALRSGADIKTVLTSARNLPELPRGVRVVEVPEELIDSVSSMKSPGTVIFTCGIEDNAVLKGKRHVLVENLQDPGNVGTIFRTANALGIDSVILLGDCADPYNPKTVRASMGAIFRERFAELDYEELKTIKEESGIRIFGSFPNETMEDVRKINFTSGIIAIGNEGQGLSDKIRSMCDINITIPMKPNCESLNAAAAATVLIWEMCRNEL